MAIYHCNISNVSRAKGSSSCATLSYITGEKVKDERLDKTYDYGRKERIESTGVMLPSNAPTEYQNASNLFNSIEKYEKADNARTGKKIEVALPRELSRTEQKELVENFIKDNITSRGYACAYGIHTDKDNNNPHAHILIANRQINDKGEWSSKRKMEYALDEQGQRIPQIDKETGLQKTDKNGRKQWKRINAEVNPLDKKEVLQDIRENWAVECNKHLTPEHQIDHRSYKEQGKEQIPTIHEGYSAREMEKRGEVSELCQYNREVRAINQERAELAQEIAENRAFIEVLKETDSRLQDLKSLGSGAEQVHTYNFAYDTVVRTMEQERRVPVLSNQGNNVIVSAEKEPSKALKLLQATKEKWNEFIQHSRERALKAHTDDLRQKADKYTPKHEKPSESLLERFKGYFQERAEQKAQEKARLAEERAKAEQARQEREASVKEILERKVSPYNHDGRIEHIRQLHDMFQNDILHREEAFNALRQYTENWHGYRDYYDVPSGYVDKEIASAIQRCERMKEIEERQIGGFSEARERFKAIQEQNKEKLAERQQARIQEREKGGHER